jgi:hypothetical protein
MSSAKTDTNSKAAMAQLLNRRRLTKEQQARLDAVNDEIERRDAPPMRLFLTNPTTREVVDLSKAPSFRKKRETSDAVAATPTTTTTTTTMDSAKASSSSTAPITSSSSTTTTSIRPSPVKRVLRLKPEFVRAQQLAADDARRVAAVLGTLPSKSTTNASTSNANAKQHHGPPNKAASKQ